MKIQKSLVVLGGTLVLLISACKNKEEQNKHFEAFKDRFIEGYWMLNPTAALYAGYHKYDTILPAPDSSYINKQIVIYKQWEDSLATFNEDALTENNRTDWLILNNTVKAAQWYLNTFKNYEWDPSGYNVGGEFAQLITEHFDNLENRLRTLSKRLEGVPAYYAAAKIMIKKPTIEHTNLSIAQNKGALDVFDRLLNDSLKKSNLSDEDIITIKIKADAAKEAVIDFITWLENDVKPTLNITTAHSFRIGKELYAKKFDFDIVSNFTADEIYKKAITRKKQLHNEMYKISKGLWAKYYATKQMPSDSLVAVKMMIDTLSVQHVDPKHFIDAIQKQLPELVGFINKKNLLYLDPAKPLVVRETPSYMRGVAGASISSPGPYEKNANTYYNVTPLDDYSPEMAESYLREYNHYILQILNIHEAIPGHYTQLVYSNQSPSLVKSIFGNGAMVEGWAVYTERMMLEEGYGNNEPEMWLMYYKWHLRVVCNTILDYSIHVNDIGKEDALKLLMNEAFQQRAEAEGKWKRASLSQVQLCSYFTGFTDIYDFREELKARQGKGFDLKKFHEKFLSYGSAPVKYIKELMLEESK